MRQRIILNKTRNFIFLVFFGMIAVSSLGSGEPITDITIEPQEPMPKSSLTFSILFDDTEDIENVRLIVQECAGDVCFTDSFNVTMQKKDPVTYEATITLRHENAQYIKYHVEYKENGNFTKYPVQQLNLKISSNGETNGDTQDNDTPGFEVITVIMILFITTLLFQRKRY